MRASISLLYCFLLLLAACGQTTERKTVDSLTDDYVATLPDTENEISSAPITDTIYQLSVGNELYDLVLWHESDETTTVTIIEKESDDTLYSRAFEFNSTGALRNPAPGCYWLSLLNSGGGSGYSATLFNIRIKPEARLQPLFNFSELSHIQGSKDGSQILFFSGMWNTVYGPDSKNFESHFSEHRQYVSLYTIKEDTVTVEELGETKLKHDFHYNDTAVSELRRTEPALAEKINWENF